MSNLLHIPLKQSKPVDVYITFGESIRKDYFQAVLSFDEDLKIIRTLRNQITNIKNQAALPESLQLLKKWYSYLITIKKKFPDDSVEFGWYNSLTYGLNGPHNVKSLKYEQLNILFQLAAVYSQLGIAESRSTDEGLKASYTYFQCSAGVFDHILSLIQLERDNILPIDFTTETLRCLKLLMLAQAQEIIWRKGLLGGNLKDTVISKLSMEVSNLYSQTLDQGNASDFIKLEWINHLTVKKLHFRAAAFYRTSLVYQNQFKYGEQIASLKVALSDCEKSEKSRKYVDRHVVEDLQGLESIVKNALKLAEKDNSLLYFKEIPGELEIAEIQGVSMVKATIPKSLLESLDIFTDLLPYIVMQVTQAFNERKQTFVSERFTTPITRLNNSLTQFLSDRKLLSQIDSIQQPENLPDSIVKHSKEIAGRGLFIESTIQEIKGLAELSKSVLDECFSRIKLEEGEDELLRLKFGSAWIRPGSRSASQDLLEKVRKLNQYLSQAEAGDQFVILKYLDIKSGLDIYCGGYDSLIKYIPNSKHTMVNSHTSDIVNDLRNLVNEAISLKDQRNEFLDGLEIKCKDNNILPEVVQEFKLLQNEIYDEMGNIKELLFEEVYESHISALFNKDLIYLRAAEPNQTSIQNQLDLLNNRFIQEYQNIENESQRKRQEALQELEVVYSKYIELISNLKEGLKFYNDFVLKSNSVLKECDEFLCQRRMQGRELERSLVQKKERRKDGIDPKSQEVELVSPISRPAREFNF